ncbi:hypothetical protein HI914_02126 [Erysiphe necator]|nr:hypothetical protein HI914_02126 [Erysiphe necator]
MAGSQNVISQIGNLLNTLSNRDPSPSRKSNRTHEKHRKHDHSRKNENKTSNYSDEMIRDQSIPQRWDAEHHSREQGYDHHLIGAEQLSPFKRSMSQVRNREGSMNEEKHRKFPLTGQDQNHHRRRRQTINSEQPFLIRDNYTSKNHEQGQKFHSPSPPRSESFNRQTVLRHQSSLDTFDRKRQVLSKMAVEYTSPTKYHGSFLPPSVPIPLPVRSVPPSGKYSKKTFDGYYQGTERHLPVDQGLGRYSGFDDGNHSSKHRGRRMIEEAKLYHSPNINLRESSTDSSWSSDSYSSIGSEFPKRGKTKIPAKLVHKLAIIELGYPFEEEGDLITILNALGRKNIDELINLSERYKADEKSTSKEHINVYTVPYTSQLNNPVIEYTQTSPPPVSMPLLPATQVPTTTYALVPPASTCVASVSFQNPICETNKSQQNFVGLQHVKDERTFNAEIKALEANKEALLTQRRTCQVPYESQGIVVLRDEGGCDGYREDAKAVRHEGKNLTPKGKSSSRNGRPRIVRDRKGRKCIAVPRNNR